MKNDCGCREQVKSDAISGSVDVERRQFVKKALSASALAAAGLASSNFAQLARAAGGAANIQPGFGSGVEFADEEAVVEETFASEDLPEVGDILVYMTGEQARQAVQVADLPPVEEFLDMQAMWVNPQTPTGIMKTGMQNTLILARVSPEDMDISLQGYATEEGIVAFSAVCTHFKCRVDRINQYGYISCACHGSVYDPARAAEPLDGPAPWPLSMIPIETTEEGHLRITGEFNAPLPL